MAAAAVPVLMKAAPFVASAVGGLIGKKTSGPNKQQQAGMAGAQQGATQMSGISSQLMKGGDAALRSGNDNLNKAGSYYGRILSGDRGAMRESMAPEISTALDYYKGSEGKINRTMSGGSRDMALAEMERGKVGNLALMGAQARQNAAAGTERVAGAHAGIAANMFGQGTNAGANAGWMNNYLFNQGSQMQEQQRQGGAGFGKMLFDIVGSLPQGGKKPSMPMPKFGGIPMYGTGF